ncbi:MAG: lysophospholipid acyltransferase family protein [Candidatus Krumholzibacteriia bacterium]
MISVACYKLGAFFARRLPPEVSESITEAILKTQYVFRRRSRGNVMHNLRRIIPEATEMERRRVTRAVFSNFARSICYFLRLPFIDPEELRANCDYDGLDEVTRDLRRKGAFILAGPHLGAWEVGGACLAALGIELATIAFPHPSRHVTRFFDERRSHAGIEGVSMGRASAGSLQRVLREGKSIVLLIDRPYGGRKRVSRMFGHRFELPIGHAALAVRCGVPVVTTACLFNGRNGFRFVHNGPHFPDRSLGYEGAMVRLQEDCRGDMETFISRHPDQWFNFDRI